ncbi:MAG: hypothetical protein IKB02_07255 [Clostridia bacterium]|nr:hypothetical protein [Clostridia bacterium]
MKKIIEFVLYLVGILYLPTIVVMSFLVDQSGSFLVFPPLLVLLLVFLMTIHFFCAFLELGFTVLRFLEKKKRTQGERILNISTASITAIILVLAIIAPDSIDVAATVLSAVLVILWVLGDIFFKQRKFYPKTFKKKSFWITVVSLFVAISILVGVTGGKIETGKPDPNDPLLEETN